MNIIILIKFISIFSPLLPIIIGFKKKKNLLWLFAVTGFLFDCFSFIIYKINDRANISLEENMFLLIEFLFISFYYKNFIFKKIRHFFLFAGFVILIFLIFMFASSIFDVNSYGAALFDFVSIVYGIAGLYHILRKQEAIFIEKSEFFWVNVAILIYCTGNFLVFLFEKYTVSVHQDYMYQLWLFHNVLNVIFSILIAFALSPKKTEY